MDQLTNNADCGPGPNQLSRFAKHLNEGDGFMQDLNPRLMDDPAMMAGPSSRHMRPGTEDQRLVDEFFNAPGLEARAGAPLQMGRMPPPMHAELEGLLDRQGPMRADWAGEFDEFHDMAMPGGGPDGALEAAFRSMQTPRDAEFERAFEQAMKSSFAGPVGDWSAEFAHQLAPGLMQPAHAEKEAFEAAWTEQFSNVSLSLEDKGKGKITELPESKDQMEAMLRSWKQEFDEKGPEAFGSTTVEEDLQTKFNDLWKDISNKRNESSWDGEFEDYAEEFGKLRELSDPDPVTGPLAEYRFEQDNPYLSHADPLAEGLRIVQTGSGTLSQAALAFEAAVQRDPHNSLAWMHLGQVQAENEKEEPAIAALQRSVQEDPKNLPALLSLAISYTNEGQELQAYASLERWVKTKYPAVVAATGISLEGTALLTPPELHERASKLYIEAVKAGPTASVGFDAAQTPSSIDPDVQIGLGVLFYIRNEYDKAIDCFHSALSARPTDYLLWNRLGATLANSGKSEEAIDAYYKALELKPTFVRCRYNLGVSCINIGCYKEAAEHFLGALSMHEVGGRGGSNTASQQANVSENLWETLRRTLIQMERRDLADLTYNDRDLSKFRKEFEF